MKTRFFSRAKEIYILIKSEMLCYLLSLIGLIKVKLFFRRAQMNRLEIGCGTSRKPGFVTTDINRTADYPFDLRIGLPFPDHSIDFIYSEHVLEHLNWRDLIALLQDCRRVLKPNGILSVVVPNARIYLNAYASSEHFDHKAFCSHPCGLLYKSKIDYVNYIFYMDGYHRYMFDEDNMIAVLREAGFSQARLRPFDPELDQLGRQYESLYAEALK
ncbi:MAG: methyltransferase domain-containing protein [Leptolyngbya sp. UWPOB_LEPTO1]|uniref:class I SAM-dependent methyltransferase n=1 Tax=Leptolyngbya sp. UWPOB_LEPTO1 TaxID=2815653 RepID=UPI001AC9BC73|nr:methyltransferase domain-containing protein [Leptolyngbya sp. UWPOB_LEPTO1]MBN8560364.1 methyltransferase domain-containing protein [Leptolyngbya sp. UWPOB_LEPTO1]